MMKHGSHTIVCWNCMGEFDLVSAGWCSCKNKGPSKVCPYCYRCSCDLPETYQEEIWKGAPPELLAEREQLARQRMQKKKSKQEQIFDMFELPRDTYNILIVEDEPALRRLLEKLIKSYFLNPLTASDGKMAMEVFNNHVIHLIILDLMIPKLNGFQL